MDPTTSPENNNSTDTLGIESLDAGDMDGWETVLKKTPGKKKQRDNNHHAQQKPVDKYIVPWIQFCPPTASNSAFQPFMLLVAGLPGSGKSTLARSLEFAMPYKFVRVNQDELRTRKRCESMARTAISEGKCPVIDRCNFNDEQRQTFVAAAQEHDIPVDCLVLDHVVDDAQHWMAVEACVRRCQKRRNHPTVDAKDARLVVSMMAAQFQPPKRPRHHQNRRLNDEQEEEHAEGFRRILYVRDQKEFTDALVEYLNKMR